jgi:hypothetical protein
MRDQMQQIRKHIIIPGLVSVAFFAVAFSPVDILGCRLRGLLALSISLLSGIAGIGIAVTSLKKRIRGEADSLWWVVTTILLTIPVVGMILMA